MGRRRRSNNNHRQRSDSDDENRNISVEEMFENRKRRSQQEPQDPKHGNVDSVWSVPTSKKQKIVHEDDKKISDLQRKKQERKRLQKEKKLQRQQQHEASKKAQEEQEAAAVKTKQERQVKKQALQNAHTRSFQTLQKGVQYLDVLVGKGPPVQDRKRMAVKYRLHARSRHGKVIDASESFSFRLGRGEVIEGWDIGLQGMKQGGIRQLMVTPQAGYGQRNVGAGVGGMLFFHVEVLKC
jgi:FKBP-type peptidyl-prolyl cis-trans isomerase